MSERCGDHGTTTSRPAWRSAIVALLLVLSSTAYADPYHAQTLPLGQRAIGMGGAFTAVADDPSATYYNPAGLVLTNDVSLSASLTLQAFDRSTVHGGYRTSEGSSTLNHDTGASLPVFISAIKLLGKKRDEYEGRRAHAIGISTFTVSQRRLSFDVEAQGPGANGPSLETLSIDNSERTVWYGISYAYRVNKRLSFGLSNFLSVSRTSYSEERISAALGDLNGDGSYASNSNAFSAHATHTNVKNLLWRIGALYAWNSRLQVGLMFQTPSLHLRGRADIRDRELTTNLGAMPVSSSVFNEHESKLTSNNPMPAELRLGSRFRFRRWLTLAADASVYGPTGTKKHPIVTVGPRAVDPVTNASPQLGAFTTDSYYRSWNGNVAIGASFALPRTVHIRAGLYTDLSSAPRIPKYSSTYYQPDVNRVGGALAVGLQSEGFDISLGMIGVVGRGHAMAFNADPSTDTTYQRTIATDRTFLFFVNGVKSAISTLAKHAERSLMDIKRKLIDEAEPELEPSARPEHKPELESSP